jgi:hypothetical protein
MSVSFEDSKITFDFRPWHSQAQREGYIAWSDIVDLLEEVFPVPVLRGSTQTAGFGIALPGYNFLRADSLHIEPLGERIIGPLTAGGAVDSTADFATLAQFEKAKVSLTYVSPTFNTNQLDLNEPAPDNPDPVSLLDHKWAAGGQYITIKPTSKMSWKNNAGKAVSDKVVATIFEPAIQHVITWPYVINPPFAAIRTCLGKINNAVMNFQTGTIEIQSLMFMGAELSGQVLSDGTKSWQVSYHFSERRVQAVDNTWGWNVFWDPIANRYDILQLNTGGSTLFTATDLSILFKPTPNNTRLRDQA